jgi:AcrR family transcriptional regulator
MGAMGRKKVITDTELLRVAREVFLEGGAFGSTRDIAARAGISEATLFKRYATKTALFLAAMAPPQPDLEFIFADVRSQKDARKAIHILANGILGYFRMAIPRMLPLITHPAIGLEELVRSYGRSPAEVLSDAVADYLAELKRTGRAAPENPPAAAGLMIAALHSVALFEIMGVHGGEVPGQAVRAMVHAMWAGMKPKGAKP